MSGGGAASEGDTEPGAGSGLRAVRTEPDAGLEPPDHELDAQLTEPPRRPCSEFLKMHSISKTKRVANT